MKTDIIPYDPYHLHLGYSLVITYVAWVTISLYCRFFLSRQPHVRTALYALILPFPLYAEGLSYLVFLLRPSPDTQLGYILTHFHANFLRRLPLDSFVAPSVGEAAFLVFGLFFLVSLVRFFYGTKKLEQFLSSARRFDAAPQPETLQRLAERAHVSIGTMPPIFVVDSTLPLALTVGIWRARIYITTSLLELLDEDELVVVLCHELAHVVRGDNRTVWMLRTLRDLSWFLPGLHFIWRAMLESQEEACDVIAARMTNASLVLARALVKVARALNGVNPRAMLLTSSFALTSPAPQTRVERMIAYNPDSSSQHRSAVIGAYALMASLLLLSLLPVLFGS